MTGRPVIFTLEMLAWAACALIGLQAIFHTWAADFPLRSAALAGEALAVAFSLLAAWIAASRRSSNRLTTALVGVRLVVGVPLLLFWLLVAAAGYSA